MRLYRLSFYNMAVSFHIRQGRCQNLAGKVKVSDGYVKAQRQRVTVLQVLLLQPCLNPRTPCPLWTAVKYFQQPSRKELKG